MHEGLAWAENFETVRLLLERLPTACIVNDSSFRFVYWNPAAEKLFGYSFEEVRGKHPFGIITPPSSQPLVEDFFRRLAQGDMGASGIGENVTKSGRIVTCDWTNTPIRATDGTFLGIISLATDLTERIERENERARLESELRHAQKMEALGTLAGGIAHDFNNILAAIIAVVELGLLDLGNPTSVERNFREILGAAQRAGALVKQILTFSRRADQTLEPAPLGPVVREVAHLLRATIPKSVELEVVLSAGEAPVLADSAQIHQVLMNLATNARQAIGNKPGGRIEIGEELVTVDAVLRARHPELTEPSYVRIWVQDNGCGMDTATLERIFEPFFTTKPPGEGTGLGLSVVHGIVTQHRGMLSVESIPNKGSIVSVYLPVHASTTSATNRAGANRDVGAGERVLVIDDEPAVASAVGALLERLGYRVEVHITAETALAAFRREPCDVVVSDLTMPGMSGLELASAVRAIAPNTPVVLTSGYGTGVSQSTLDDRGVTALLHKPYTQIEIARAVRAALLRR